MSRWILLGRWFVAFALMQVVSGGCGGGAADVKFAEVQAVVLLDGSPVENATVTLVPVTEGQGVSATGTTDASGRARLLPVVQGGRVEGEYFVGVIKAEVPKAAEEEEEETSAPTEQYPAEAQIKHVVPKKYNNPRTSGIRVSIAAGQKEVRIELKSGE